MSDELDVEVEQRLTFVLARLPGWFDEDELARLRAQIRELVEASRKLGTFPLTNADEPDFLVQMGTRQ
ncbi:hypothetical protein NET03_03225 [Thermomicrobium sp. CFH 73360]|uniref:hypothetical protein n=1 Tax=Thermomicrobium sp. CFH 73360 TaxID=2951987 RepID=UPI002076A5E6|nr:hypothetical protein [Thermomicrobium sp. CFH 73360]MCM8745536.1 hypothetical protein [Thermomicrobium sp. CFH 73360]